MKQRQRTFAKRITGKVLIWIIFIAGGLSYGILHLEGDATKHFYSEIYHNKMLITYEYTRRVISDVYVAVTNNIYYLEHTLDKPDEHKKTMERIVKSGTRIRSCGISFVKDYYYPQKEHRFCPFAWRNTANPDEVSSQDMGDADLDYLAADWFQNVIKCDSAYWADPFYDGYDNETALSAYMVPIHDQEGRVVAVLGADISLDWLTNKLSEVDTIINSNNMIMASMFEMKSETFIINHDGAYITHSNEESILKDNFFSQLEASDGSDVEELVNNIKRGITPAEKAGERYLVNGKECYLFYTPVKYTQWILVTLVPCKAIDILSYLNGFAVVLIVLLAIGMIGFVGYYYVRNGIEPVKQLTTVAEDIVKGKYDTPIPETKHNDEISQLRDAMAEMQYTLSNNPDNGRK